jgi:hypothetical protein
VLVLCRHGLLHERPGGQRDDDQPGSACLGLGGGITNETFAANWSAVAGAASYHLDVCAVPSFSGSAPAGARFSANHGHAHGRHDDLGRTRGQRRIRQRRLRHVGRRRDNPADLRTSTASTNYVDPAGTAASGGANVYFSTNGLTGSALRHRGHRLARLRRVGAQLRLLQGIVRDEHELRAGLVHGRRDVARHCAVQRFAVGQRHEPLVRGVQRDGRRRRARFDQPEPALDAANGLGPGRIDDVLLQGYADSAEFAAGYSNRTVTGATSQSVTA